MGLDFGVRVDEVYDHTPPQSAHERTQNSLVSISYYICMQSDPELGREMVRGGAFKIYLIVLVCICRDQTLD